MENNRLVVCNYCGVDLTMKVRFACLVCEDFDLCPQCFSVGASLFPHNVQHPYRIVDNIRFELVEVGWTFEEEMKLLDAIEELGLYNWNGVSILVETKTAEQCDRHYYCNYLNDKADYIPEFLPDDYIAMSCMGMTDQLNEFVNKPIDYNINNGKDWQKRLFTALQPLPQSIRNEIAKVKRRNQFSSKTQLNQNMNEQEDVFEEEDEDDEQIKKDESPESQRRKMKNNLFTNKINNKKTKDNFKPSDVGYYDKRGEYDCEWDNEAETYIADLSMLPCESPIEIKLKLDLLHAYNRTINERIRRKIFVLDHGLLNIVKISQIESHLPKFDKTFLDLLKPFARFFTAQQFNTLIRGLKGELQLRCQIAFWQRQKTRGLNTVEEVAEIQEIISQNSTENEETQFNDDYVDTKTAFRKKKTHKKENININKEGLNNLPTEIDDYQFTFIGAMHKPRVYAITQALTCQKLPLKVAQQQRVFIPRTRNLAPRLMGAWAVQGIHILIFDFAQSRRNIYLCNGQGFLPILLGKLKGVPIFAKGFVPEAVKIFDVGAVYALGVVFVPKAAKIFDVGAVYALGVVFVPKAAKIFDVGAVYVLGVVFVPKAVKGFVPVDGTAVYALGVVFVPEAVKGFVPVDGAVVYAPVVVLVVDGAEGLKLVKGFVAGFVVGIAEVAVPEGAGADEVPAVAKGILLAPNIFAVGAVVEGAVVVLEAGGGADAAVYEADVAGANMLFPKGVVVPEVATKGFVAPETFPAPVVLIVTTGRILFYGGYVLDISVDGVIQIGEAPTELGFDCSDNLNRSGDYPGNLA
ncbi:MAG: putative histone acetyltransferase complex component [Streblomastix strix]|uniref:Putative histone acetyltransferase complex component n=1 Tax=Streblomastix strix TaxID=222440 RepID=A0A5J4VHA8_9EUKA|nr:MAG: putative histone acetyltransferase complex component [Streblomastix strix]